MRSTSSHAYQNQFRSKKDVQTTELTEQTEKIPKSEPIYFSLRPLCPLRFKPPFFFHILPQSKSPKPKADFSFVSKNPLPFSRLSFLPIQNRKSKIQNPVSPSPPKRSRKFINFQPSAFSHTPVFTLPSSNPKSAI
jgi:hypothetical protein